MDVAEIFLQFLHTIYFRKVQKIHFEMAESEKLEERERENKSTSDKMQLRKYSNVGCCMVTRTKTKMKTKEIRIVLGERVVKE